MRPLLATWRSAWPALLLLAGGEALLAGLAAMPASLALVGTAHRPALAALAGADWLNVLVELTGSSVSRGGLVAAPTGPGAGALAAALGLLAIGLHGLLHTFVSGAALARMAGREGSVWSTGAAWFWPMMRLGVLLVATVPALAALGGVLLALLPGGNALALTLKLLAWLLWLGGLGCWFELARALMVARGDPGARRAAGRALRALADRPGRVLGVWLGLGAGHLAADGVVLGLTLAAGGAGPTGAWLAALVAIILGTAYKLLRLAAQLRLASGALA